MPWTLIGQLGDWATGDFRGGELDLAAVTTHHVHHSRDPVTINVLSADLDWTDQVDPIFGPVKSPEGTN